MRHWGSPTVFGRLSMRRGLPARNPMPSPSSALWLSSVLYVGNSLAYDVAGAQNAGLPVAWLRGDEELGDYEPEYVIDSLAELPAILRGEG